MDIQRQVNSSALRDQKHGREGEGPPPEVALEVQRPCLCESQGVALLVVNTPRSVVLAPTGHPGADAGSFEDKAGVLAWFIKELASDIEALQKKHVDENACDPDGKNTCDSESSCSPSDAEPGEDDTAKAIMGGLEVLRASSAVRFATWEPFQKAFKITKMNTESIKEFNVVPPRSGRPPRPTPRALAMRSIAR